MKKIVPYTCVYIETEGSKIKKNWSKKEIGHQLKRNCWKVG